MSNAVRMAADRAPDEERHTCPACGTPLVDPEIPSGYSREHCAWCAAAIEDRHTWHARRDSVGGGR